MLGRFHALGDDDAAEGGSESDDAFDNCQILGVPEHIAHKTLVDLEHTRRQASEIGE